jgi:hypothetical protein
VTDTFAIAIALFFLGACILLAFFRDGASMKSRWMSILEELQNMDSLYARRAESLPTLIQRTSYYNELRFPADDVRGALKRRSDPVISNRREMQMEAEQELSRLVLWLCKEAEEENLLHTDGDPEVSEAVLKVREIEAEIALARERYNEVAEVWNAYRRIFPLGLLSRALMPSVAPLYKIRGQIS